MDHPEIEDFINWKVREEKKAHALIAAGYRERLQRRGLPHGQRPELEQLDPRHRRVHEGRARRAARGRRARARPARSSTRSTRSDLWRQLAEAAWGCADPGVQYDTTINRWHTCPNTGPINASNPCSEYMFLDDSACNLVELNLTKFLARGRRRSTSTATATRSRVFFVAQEILVDFSTLPDRSRSRRTRTTIARSASATRTSARCSCSRACRTTRTRVARSPAALTAIMCGHAYTVRAEMAASKGAVRRLRQEPRADAARDAACTATPPTRSIATTAPRPLWRAAVRGLGRRRAARRAARLPQRAGDRARADRHHRPPDGLRHDRHRARLRAREVQEARRRRLLQDRQPVGARGAPAPRLLARREVQEIVAYVSGTNTLLARAARQPRERSRQRGLTDDDLGKVETAIPGVFDLDLAFAPWVLGEETYERLGVDGRARARPASRSSSTSASPRREIEEANDDHHRPHDDRGRAVPRARALRGVRLREPLRQERASASSRRCRT